jgi:coenzyme PQQ synthesis protein D (PqqD)
MNQHDRVVIPKHILARQLNDETVILDLDSGTYFGLDEVGTRVWQLLGQGLTLAEICGVLIAEFEVPRETLERDLVALTDNLLSHNLMTVV